MNRASRILFSAQIKERNVNLGKKTNIRDIGLCARTNWSQQEARVLKSGPR